MFLALRVMKENDITRASGLQSPRHSLGLRREDRIIEPRLPKNQRRVEFSGGAYEFRSTNSGGRTEPDGGVADRLRDHPLARRDPLAKSGTPGKISRIPVIGGMIPDRVPTRENFAGERRFGTHALTDQKKRRPSAERVEEIEYSRSSDRIRSVVEREVEGAFPFLGGDSPDASFTERAKEAIEATR